MRRRGRRPGGEDTRGAIVEAAREEFTRCGYEATSLRAVARRAGVDPALVHHYFSGKAALFAEVIGALADPSALVGAILEEPRPELGRALVRTFLAVWDSPQGRDRFEMVFRSTASHEGSATMLREFLAEEVFGRIVTAAGDPQVPLERRRLRAGLAASQMVGFAVMRYVLRLSWVVDATPEELVDELGPVLQRYLVG